MTVRTVIRYPDDRLRKKSEPVGDMDPAAVMAVVGDLIETMYAAKGQGLSAPQIGVSSRIFVIDTTYFKTGKPAPQVFIDPEVTPLQNSNKLFEVEGCLSFPGVNERIPRMAAVTVKFRTVNTDPGSAAVFKEQNMMIAGHVAVVIQHENDHLDGILLVDHLARAARRHVDKKIRKAK